MCDLRLESVNQNGGTTPGRSLPPMTIAQFSGRSKMLVSAEK